ncbi:hypothetical protein [Bdellovibrio sp. HCB209]|uniref:hypothetical protein n=1 Tax=Bdellovibrio sp. HCB209 TaxID=3394354 RepID=UPI0039B406ED
MKSDLRFRFILLLIFITAFCSYAYELVIANILSVLWGNVVQQYTVTTGIYIAAMGAGAYLAPIKLNAKRSFIWIEVALSICALASPFILVYSDINLKPASALISYVMISAIGFLSGMELPLLMRIMHSESLSEEKNEQALFTDYVGMFAAGIIFALFLNRQFGTLHTNLWLAMGNLGLALVCGLLWGYQDSKIRKIEMPTVLVLFVVAAWIFSQNLLIYEEQIARWIIAN